MGTSANFLRWHAAKVRGGKRQSGNRGPKRGAAHRGGVRSRGPPVDRVRVLQRALERVDLRRRGTILSGIVYEGMSPGLP